MKDQLSGQTRWQRIMLLCILAYEGLGGLAGGGMLIAEPDGRLMDMPTEILHGTFTDFLVPGIILLALGILTCIAFFIVLRRSHQDWVWSALAMGGFTIWFIVEIIVLKELHWLHAMWGLPVLAGDLLTIPLLPFRRHEVKHQMT